MKNGAVEQSNFLRRCINIFGVVLYCCRPITFTTYI